MTKFTPGPWEVGSHPAIPGSSIVRPVLFGSNIRVLPEHEGGHVCIKNPADAHLIAASPDLYEALEAVVAVADRKTVEFDLARAALKRARGEA